MSERQSAASKARWRDPEQREKLLKALRNPVRNGKLSSTVKERWDDPEQRETLMAAIRASHANPAVRKKISDASKARWSNPKTRERIVAAIRASKGLKPQSAEPQSAPTAPAALRKMDAETFKAWRKLRGLTQQETATALGVSRRVVTGWETGTIAVPKMVILAIWAVERGQSVK